jgi:hypothetical protein
MSERNIRMRHHAMATEDGFDPGPLPRFLLRADEPEQGIGNDKAVISLRGLMASLLAAAALATGIAILSDQMTLFTTASLVDKSAPQPGTDQPTPTIQSAVIQSTDVAVALPPTAKDALTREISAPEPASQTQKENSEPSSEALFREFQAWSAEQKDAHALAKPVQDAPARVVENAPAPVRPTQKHRTARSVHNAQAKIRHVREHRANVQHPRVQARPVQDARGETQSVQNAEPPSFLESLNPFAGWPTLTNR